VIEHDNRVAVSLAAAGYLVLPLWQHKKYPNKNGWRDAWDNQDIAQKYRAMLLSDESITGAAICFRKSDPVKICVIDVDQPDKQNPVDLRTLLEEAIGGWPDAPVVYTPNGGIHLWFSYEGALRLPHSVRLGNVHCDIRYSDQAKPLLLVLPGSVVFKADGNLGTYQIDSIACGDVFTSWVDDGLPGPELPRMPEALLQRLTARADTDPDRPTPGDEVRLPTEVHIVLRRWPNMRIGERSDMLAELGLLLGRIAPFERIPDAIRAAVLNAVMPRLEQSDDDRFSEAEAWGIIARRWREGKKNWSTYVQPHVARNPSLSAVTDECRVLWGEVPKFTRLLQSDRVVGWRATIKGKTIVVAPGDIQRIAQDISRALGRLEAHANSPLFTKKAWNHVFCELLVRGTCDDERIGEDIQQAFLRIFGRKAEVAALRGDFVSDPGKLQAGHSRPFVLVSRDTGPEMIVLPRRAQEKAMGEFDMELRADAWTRLQRVAVKVRIGRYRTEALGLPLTDLPEEQQEVVRSAWEQWVKEQCESRKKR